MLRWSQNLLILRTRRGRDRMRPPTKEPRSLARPLAPSVSSPLRLAAPRARRDAILGSDISRGMCRRQASDPRRSGGWLLTRLGSHERIPVPRILLLRLLNLAYNASAMVHLIWGALAPRRRRAPPAGAKDAVGVYNILFCSRADRPSEQQHKTSMSGLSASCSKRIVQPQSNEWFKAASLPP